MIVVEVGGTLMRMFIWAISVICAAVAGFYYARYNPEVEFAIGSPQVLPVTKDFGCDSPAYASIFTTLDGKSVRTYGGRGTDTAAIKVDSDNKRMTMVTGAGVKLGVTQGETYPILQETKDTIVAALISPMGAVNALIMQKETGLVMWTKAQDSLVLGGQAIFLKCS
jgi:hypothetical protein